jgi:Ca-activated chloride channel family protein
MSNLSAILAISHFRFQDPLWFLAILGLPLILWLRSRTKVTVLLIPHASAWHRPSLFAPSRWPLFAAIFGACLVIAGLARPQRVEEKQQSLSRGYDIVLCIDLSTSMLSEDYERNGQRLNRLQAIKPVIQAFIDQRPTDRIGIVLFESRAYTLAPLTTDHEWLSRQLSRVKIGIIQDGTAIGDGLGVALTRLDQASRDNGGKRLGAFIVLLTDGGNNCGAITPMQSAAIAAARGIPIYTIGAGQDGYVPFPVFDDKGNKVGYRRILADLDEGALKDIANKTGGKFFRAADSGTIESAFASIDKTQKIEFQAKSYLLTKELFHWVTIPGLGFIGLAALGATRRQKKSKSSPVIKKEVSSS